jgi:hypothetical protein
MWVGVSPYKKKRIWGYLVDPEDNGGNTYSKKKIRTFWGYEAGEVYFQIGDNTSSFAKKLKKRMEQHPQASQEVVDKVRKQYEQELVVRILKRK